MTPTVDVITIGSLFVELTPTTPGEALTSAQHYTLVAGGAAANVVFALARLGVRVGFLTAVGDDDFGDLLTRELAAFGVDTAHVYRAPDQLTPVSFCAIDCQGGKRFSFYRFPHTCAPMAALGDEQFSNLSACRLFDFSEGSIRDAALRPRVFQAARDQATAGSAVLYAVNLRRHAWRLPEAEIRSLECQAIRLADIVVLNGEELAFITARDGSDALRDLQQLGPRVVVVTHGGETDITLRVGDETATVSPCRVPVIYDVGAGDTFHAALVAAALHHDVVRMPLDAWVAAAHFAAAASAIRVSTSADPRDLPTFAQVSAWIEARRASHAPPGGV